MMYVYIKVHYVFLWHVQCGCIWFAVLCCYHKIRNTSQMSFDLSAGLKVKWVKRGMRCDSLWRSECVMRWRRASASLKLIYYKFLIFAQPCSTGTVPHCAESLCQVDKTRSARTFTFYTYAENSIQKPEVLITDCNRTVFIVSKIKN